MSKKSRVKDIASMIRQGMPKWLAFANTHTIADTRATSIFVMAGTPKNNICSATDPLTRNIPNGEIVSSTHICNIVIPGLLMILTGHIVPGLSMASLMGIRDLCKAAKCEVKYQNKVISTGIKDPTINLWSPLITPTVINATGSQKLGEDQRDQKKTPPLTGQHLHIP
jgi:hypothetical protein